MNERHLTQFPGDTELAARIASYELAAKMQLSVPEISDLSTEPEHILSLYGANDSTKRTEIQLCQKLYLARRLVEKSVRFVQLFNGAYQTGGEGTSNWDGHKFLEKQYAVHGQILDQPVAGLLKDLKQRRIARRYVSRLVY